MPVDPERLPLLDAIANGGRDELRRRVDEARRDAVKRGARVDRSLAALMEEAAPLMPSWLRPATVDHVHDGDTIVVAIDLGKIGRKRAGAPRDLGWHISERADGHILLKSAVRVQGSAAPELKTAAGKASAAFARTLLAPGDLVSIDSLKLYGSFEKYGRVLASVKLSDGRDLAEAMTAAGHAVAWDGTGKQPGA